MKSSSGCLIKVVPALLLILALGAGWRWWTDRKSEAVSERDGEDRAVPVDVAEVRVGSIAETRIFSGTLEPSAESRVAAKVSGRVARVRVDLADAVARGDILAELDDSEFRQQVARAEADLAVAEARRVEADNRLEIARRDLDRVETLTERGVRSASALDEAKANLLARTSALEVAKSEVLAAEAEVESARIQLAHTRVRAMWSEGDDSRVIAERRVDEGDTVQANVPLFRVIETRPLRAVIFVPEREYRRLRAGQPVSLTTDAWPGRTFEAEISRVSPVFEEESRQARVEVRAPNAENRLKPGMFIRAAVVLERHEDALLAPEAALTRRGGIPGVFHVEEDATASWVPVTPGIRHAGEVELLHTDLRGRVVTLGQRLLDDGSPLILPEADRP